MNIVIVYHSGYGHTKIVAEHIRKGAAPEAERVSIISTLEAQNNFEWLHAADAIVFGCPTYMGAVSAAFKKFMEATGKFSYEQSWKDKLAAGFTNSSTLIGDKTNTIQQLAAFAAQHGMLWVSTGVLSEFENDQQLEKPNGLGSYLGLMTVSDNAIDQVNPPKGLYSAELFGRRIALITKQIKCKN
jgi:NAD(P)H dehydrogenase (quinone)